MSNRYHGTWMVIDTTDTQIGGLHPTGGMTGNLRITGMQWIATSASNKDIADGDKLIIEWERDGGDIVISVDAQLAAVTGSVLWENHWHYKPWIVPGLYIEDIDGGELNIWLD